MYLSISIASLIIAISVVLVLFFSNKYSASSGYEGTVIITNTRTGEIYYYRPKAGYFKYDKNKARIWVDRLPLF